MSVLKKLKHAGSTYIVIPMLIALMGVGLNNFRPKPSILEQKVVQEVKPKEEKQTIEHYLNPRYEKDDNFVSDDEKTLLARAICGEARGQLDNEDYLYGVFASIINRAKIKKTPIKETLLKRRKKGKKTVYHFTCFDPNDRNYEIIKDPFKKISKDEKEAREIWEACYNISEKILNNEIEVEDPELKEATNYFVATGNPQKYRTKLFAKKNQIPSWAYKMDENGFFILDKKKRRIPRDPIKIVQIDSKRKAYFYSFKNY